MSLQRSLCRRLSAQIPGALRPQYRTAKARQCKEILSHILSSGLSQRQIFCISERRNASPRSRSTFAEDVHDTHGGVLSRARPLTRTFLPVPSPDACFIKRIVGYAIPVVMVCVSFTLSMNNVANRTWRMTRNYPSNCGEVEKNITSTRATPRSRRKVSNISVPVGMYATTVTELHSQTTPETQIRLPSTTLTCVRPCTVNHPSVCGSHRRSYVLRATIFVRRPAASLRFPGPFRRKRGSGP